MGVESHSSPPLPGAKPYGKYYLLDRIGTGGMAEVFLAVAIGPEGFQRTLVIKRMLPHLSQDQSFVRMFIDEAKLSGLLSHPNLVQIFEFGSIDDSFFIAMEHVHGETLLAVQAKLGEAGRLAPVAASLEIVRQVCLGLHYAHALESTTGQPLGIVHRDISPSNLMLSFHGGVKILDFGIARVAEGLRESRTQAGTMKGKVSYMSPEQVRMEEVDNRSDIFAIGIVLHEMLTGRRLFRSTNEYTGARMVLEAAVPIPSVVNPEVPPAVDAVVMRALERNPQARYQTAGEMAEDLEKALFEMRASPHEPRKLLSSLFPQGPSRTGEIRWTGTPSPWTPSDAASPPSLSQRSPTSSPGGSTAKPVPHEPAVDIEMDGFAPSGRITAVSPRRGRRRWVALVGLGCVVALVVLLLPHRAVPPPEVVIAPAAAQAASAPAPTPAPALAPALAPAPAAKVVVQVSLDSSPQDAQVTREDSGEVVGRTPITIALPQSRDVISFRFDKPGHASTSYKVIPDLDKAVRAELTADSPTDPKHVSSSHRPPTHAHHGALSGTPAEVSPASPQARDCLLSVASFPWTELWIDGKDTGQRTPVVHYPVACGAHKLGLKRRDLKLDKVEQVTVAPDHELKQHYELGDEYGGD